VLEVATRLFVERGFNGTTMEAVAQAAGIGKQAVYMRFPDKESLFAAVIGQLKDDDPAPQLPDDDRLPLRDGMRRCIHAILVDCAGTKATLICKLAMREGHRFPEILSLLNDATLARFVGPLTAYLAARNRKGEIRDIDTAGAAGLCVDLIFAETSRAVFRETPLSPAQIERCADRIVDLVLEGIAAR